MPPKRQSIGRSTSRARQAKALRASETQEQREARVEADRLQTAQARASETQAQREARVEANRSQTAQARASETQEQREARRIAERSRAVRTRRTMHADLNLGAFHYDANYDYSLHPSVIIGPMDKVCPHCKAMKFKNETPGMCCASGKTDLPQLQPPLEPLMTLLSGVGANSKHFLSKIRKYNACFQMTSFGADKIHHDAFMPTFRIQGQIYHQLGALLPLPSEEHKFLQIYFIGDESNDQDQVQQRQQHNDGTRQQIVTDLQVMMHANNALVEVFKYAYESLRNQSDQHRVVFHADRTPAGQHPGRFNAPTVNDIAVLMVGDQVANRDIIIYRRQGQLQRIAETHRSYDALQYPIMFPYGEDGYHFELKQINRDTRMFFHFTEYKQNQSTK